jgi:protein-disulfide isomerase
MGTPGIFINGTPLSGAQSESAFERVIESELAKSEKKRAAN